ncbi:ankyrin repeat domain-containing protein [Nocardia sp. NPDC050710]|uniref:ankyrin repeat domain-containing protein n=1 Tax=Nocardia sp. NPDC050710 TaxID=3157220 RepID=UPI0033DF3926
MTHWFEPEACQMRLGVGTLSVMLDNQGGWAGIYWSAWTNLELVRTRLEAGANPDFLLRDQIRPLDAAAEYGSPEVVAELATRVSDVDAVSWGRTALWRAVHENRIDTARALVEAGADLSRPMMAGWSSGKLSLAGPHPMIADALSASDQAAVDEGHRLTSALGKFEYEGLSLACVAGIDIAEAVRRLNAEVVSADSVTEEEMGTYPLANHVELTLWATDVPGGCVIVQPWAYGAWMTGVSTLLSAGTTCYAMYANPKSGNQGSIVHNGQITGRGLYPASYPRGEDDSAEEILASYLFQHSSIAYCCAYTGLRLTDSRAFVGPPDLWLRLPNRDWH